MSNEKVFQELLQENWQGVFGMLLGREPVIGFGSVDKLDKAAALARLDQSRILLKLLFSENEEDRLFLSVERMMVSMVANLMMGIESFSEEVGADDLDAFAEAVNQMFSACQVPILEKTGQNMKFGGISYIKVEEAAGLVQEEPLLLWNVGFQISGMADSSFFMLSPQRFVEASVDRTQAKREEPVKNTGKKPGETFKGSEGNIELLMDVELPITVRIGSTEMKLVDIMRLGIGSIIELEKMVDDPVEVLVNDKIVAKGEVVVYNGNFAIRVLDVQSREARIKSLAD